jgi:hypothetical protein
MAPKSPDLANPFASTQAQQPESAPSRKPARAQASKREGTKAATFYFHPATLDRLHAAWVRAVATEGHANKSEMVERALLAYLEGIGEG